MVNNWCLVFESTQASAWQNALHFALEIEGLELSCTVVFNVSAQEVEKLLKSSSAQSLLKKLQQLELFGISCKATQGCFKQMHEALAFIEPISSEEFRELLASSEHIFTV